LVVLNLGGFGGSGNGNIWNIPSLGERRVRNKELIILEGKQVASHKKKQ
jgi:hypothetical protein